MKFSLAIFFLFAALPALASSPQPEVKETFFNGELCGRFDQTKAYYQPYGEPTNPIEGALLVTFAGQMAGKAADQLSATCEATLKIEYPKGYRFYVMSPSTDGMLEAGANVSIDTELEIRTGLSQLMSYHHAVQGNDFDATHFDIIFGEPLNGKELRSDCSGSAEIVFTNKTTLRPTGRLNPGEIDDISMAYVDRSSTLLTWERCNPGEP